MMKFNINLKRGCLDIFVLTAVSLVLALASPSSSSDTPTIKQITFGPENHFYGYIGHVGNTPWNESGKYMVMLRTTFRDRMPGPEDAADIVILDTAKDYAEQKVEETRAWNHQQGTMLYWNPDKPETQFFFNDRDLKTQKVFCALYDIETKSRVKEFRFEDTPFGNSGVAQKGGWFLGLNYGRMDRLRKVTGYGGAYDWTVGEKAPKDDGVFKVNVETGEKTLLVSFAALAERLIEDMPYVTASALFINHTLWSRDDSRILFYVRGNWDEPHGPMINAFFTMHADGSNLTRHKTFPGGHPEWASSHTLIGSVHGRQVIYDVDTQEIVSELGNKNIFPKPGGDVALSRDGQWFVNGYTHFTKNLYVIFNMDDGTYFRTPGIKRGLYQGALRIDPAPCWRRDNRAIAVPGLADDGSRQTFVIEF